MTQDQKMHDEAPWKLVRAKPAKSVEWAEAEFAAGRDIDGEHLALTRTLFIPKTRKISNSFAEMIPQEGN